MNLHLRDDQLSPLLAGALPEDELARAEAHLWDCSRCRDALRRRTEPVPDLPPLSESRLALADDEPPAVPGYQTHEEVGRGGMGVVYRATQARPSRTVALKVLRAGLPADADAGRRFRAEAEALARLQHAGIVQVYEVGEAAGRPFFSLEFCAGGSLAKRLAGAPLPPREAAALVEAVARAVAAAHRAGIVHRDLKPANILLASGGREPPDPPLPSGGLRPPLADCIPKVTDFGLAKFLAPDSLQLTARSAPVLGTPSYAAPEQVAGRAGPAVDIYSLGAILYECLTGRPPFKAATVLETLELARSRDPVSIRQVQPGVPRDLETICLKCLEKPPARRYASAEGLADDLRRFLEGRPIAARPVSRPERLGRWARRNPATAALAAVLTLALVAGLATAFALWRRAEGHLTREETARQEAEENYLTCRGLLADYIAVTRAPGSLPPEARRSQREALARARTFCERVGRQRPDDPGLRRDLAEVCTGLAALDTHDGRLDGAREAGETARRLWEELRDEAPGDPRCSDRLAAVLLTLGSVYERLGRSADSAAVLRQAIALWERLAGEGFTPTRCLVAAATARRFLADRMSEQGRSGEVTRLYEENRARLDGLISAGNTAPEVRQELLYTLSELGEQYQHDGMQAEADRCWRRGHDLGRQLADEIPDNPRVVYCLAVCGQNLAARDPAAAHPAEITRLCRQAARLLEAQRQRDPTNQDTGRTLADVYFSLSDSSQQAGRPGEALRAARRAVEVLADLTDHRPDDPAARLDLFVGQARLAVREQQCGDPAAAKATARRAVEGFEQFCEAQASGPGATAVAAPCCGSLAAALRHAGALDLSLRVAERCRRMFEELVRRRADDPRHLIGLSEAWTQIGKVHWRGDRHELTEAALRESAAAATRLAECWPEYGQLRDERRRRLGRFLEERGRVAEAAAYLRPPE